MKNLISISGKIGSGKDTVGTIIQYLTSNQQNNSFEEVINNNIKINTSIWEIKKMAGKLKQVASILTNIPVENFENQEFKKMQMHSCWGMTYREFLQKIGTDAMRNGLHEDTWLNAFWVDYRPPMDVTYVVNDYSKYPKWIITDVRFENEYNSVRERGGLMIKVTRSLAVCGTCYKTGTANELDILSQSGRFVNGHCKVGDIIPNDQLPSHASETGLDHITDWDWVIHNDGTIEDLIEMVQEMLIKENII